MRTRLTDLLGIDYPIISAPMTRMSGSALAGEISAAGGLGTFGGASVASRVSPRYVQEQIAAIRARTDRPFGVGFITHNLPAAEANFAMALEAGVPVILFSFADPSPWLSSAKAAGATTVCQVQTMEDAEQAVGAGTDVLAVQGHEAGGHTGRANLLPFLVQALEAFPSVPVVAAGGITNGRTLAAVLAAGADGAWMGTAFIASSELTEVPDGHKQAVVASDGRDTVYSTVYDVMNQRAFGDIPFVGDMALRAKRNDFLSEWHGREAELVQRVEAFIPGYVSAWQVADTDLIPLMYGEGAHAVKAIRPASQIMRDICLEAEQILRDRVSGLLER